MAILKSSVLFTGTLGDLSAYTMRGSDKVILRRKGGPSKKRIQSAPSFENTRRLNAEFAGRSTATKWIMRALHHHRPLADHSFTGKLNALFKPIQELDTVHAWGKRSIRLTANTSVLEGFPLNIGTTFEKMVRTPYVCEFIRETGQVTASFPTLIPDINFFPPDHPVFSLVVGAGIFPDLHYKGSAYQPINESVDEYVPVAVESPWYPTNEILEPLVLTLPVPDEIIQPNTSVVITVGIKFGRMFPNGTAQQVKNAGAGVIRLVR